MGINVELHRYGPRPRRGRVPTQLVSQVVDWDDHLSSLVSRARASGHAPTWSAIDPYARVVMSPSEAVALLNEITVVSASAANDSERHLLDEVEPLIRRCAHEDPAYRLYFEGD